MTNQTPDAKMVLLPCPFCGGEARIFDGYHGGTVACCRSCGNGTDECGTAAEASALWNSRITTQSTWHPINPADQSTLPGEDDADEDGYIWVRFHNGYICRVDWRHFEYSTAPATHWAPRIKQVPPVWESDPNTPRST